MEMKSYTVNCRCLTDKAAVHRYFKVMFGFPDYYGSNLDALYDCLSEVPPCRVTFKNVSAINQLGDYAAPLLAVFRDTAKDRPDFVVIIDE